MNDFLIASAGAAASAGAVLVILLAASVLLTVRAWSAVKGVVLTTRVTILLNTSIVVLGAIFLVLVFVRFKTVV